MYKIHLIHFDVFSRNIESLKASLTQDELQRAKRFVRESDAHAYIIAHAQLRCLLAQYLKCTMQDLVLAADVQGKPFIVHPDSNIHFNMSHSGKYALIGVSDAGAIGVDIEQVSKKLQFAAIAQRFFTSNEYLYIVSQPAVDQAMAFFQVWTYKEAYVKAIGRGLSYGLDTFSVVSSDLQLISCLDDMQFIAVDAPTGYVAMVCCAK